MLAALLVTAPRGARAEPPRADDEPIEVVVQGSPTTSFSTKTTPETALGEVIDGASLIDELPSVHVRKLGADGAFGAVSVRGSASTQVAVLLGGVPLSSGADPTVDVGSLPLWPGAVVRVYRGFSPAALGTTGYLGGVLTLDPDPASRERTEVWTAVGSFGGARMRIGDTTTVGDWSFSTGLSASRSDGDFSYEDVDPTTHATTTRTRENAGHKAIGAVERVARKTSWGGVSALVFADTRRQGLAGTTHRPTRHAELGTTRVIVGSEAFLKTSEVSAAYVRLWGRDERASYDDPSGELGVVRRASSGDDRLRALGLAFGLRGRFVDSLTSNLFVDGRLEDFEPTRIGAIQRATAARRGALGIGTDLSLRAASALELALVARLDGRRDRTDEGAPSDDARATGHVGASYTVNDALIVGAHVGAVGRPPSFVELYGDRGALLGDPTLRPERALSADVGLRGSLVAADVALGYELVAFGSRADDLITFEERGEGTLVARNIDRALLYGVELSLSLSSRTVRSTLTYTGLHSENQGDQPLTSGRPLPGRPAHDLAYDVVYAFAPFDVHYGVDAIAGTFADTAGRIELPARFFHEVGAGLTLDVVRVGIEIDNLLDLRVLHRASDLGSRPVAVAVSDFLDFPLPGRTFWVTARARFGAR